MGSLFMQQLNDISKEARKRNAEYRKSNAMKLRQYIKENYATQREFAEAMGTSPQQVTNWLKNEFIVVDGMLYRPAKEIKEGESK